MTLKEREEANRRYDSDLQAWEREQQREERERQAWEREQRAQEREAELERAQAQTRAEAQAAQKAAEQALALAALAAAPRAAATPAAGTAQPKRLRSWVTRHNWVKISAEIARRCLDPSGRAVVPKNESRLVEGVLQWCGDTFGFAPTDSDMRDAVRTVCATLREGPQQPPKKRP